MQCAKWTIMFSLHVILNVLMCSWRCRVPRVVQILSCQSETSNFCLSTEVCLLQFFSHFCYEVVILPRTGSDCGICSAGNKCFKLVHGLGAERRDWAGALEVCRSGPGHNPDLASISSELENGTP